MRLATVSNGEPDGRLVLISRDNARFLVATGIADTLQRAIERWTQVDTALQGLADRLERGEGDLLDKSRLLAPLPRAWQWLDGSAFMQRAFHLPALETTGR